MAPRNVPPVAERDPYDEYNDRIAAEQNGADTGFYAAPTQRFTAPSTSTRRYTVDRSVNPPTALRKAGQSAGTTRSRAGNNQTVETRRGDDEVLYGSSHARRTTGSRPRTSEDPQVTTNVRRVNTSGPASGMSRRKMVGVVIVSLVAGVIGGNAAINAVHDLGLQMAQGPYPVRNVDLVCGHGDSASNPTRLHVYIWDHEIRCIESPGGNQAKDRELAGTGLPTTGDMSRWDLEVVPVKVGRTTYQIEINVTGPSLVYRWLLVDGGQGYFVGVK